MRYILVEQEAFITDLGGNVMRSAIAVFSVNVICLLGKTVPAFAQSAGAERGANTGLEEVIVTAQKREERLLDVPVSVAAYGAEDLIAARVTNLQDLTALSYASTAHAPPNNSGAHEQVIGSLGICWR